MAKSAEPLPNDKFNQLVIRQRSNKIVFISRTQLFDLQINKKTYSIFNLTQFVCYLNGKKVYELS